jgi:hypothetical protein
LASRYFSLGIREFAASVALIFVSSAAVFSQNAFDAALAALPGEVRDVKSAGRWRMSDADGVYRVIVLRVGYEHVADRLYIQWLRNGVDDQSPQVIASVGVSEINEVGEFTFSHALQPEATNRLRIIVNARHTYTGERRQFVFLAGAPHIYTLRPVPSATLKKPL